MQELMAFWANSNGARPMLCGTIEGWTDNGQAKIKEYGQGFAVVPLLVLPKAAAMKKYALLQKYESEHILATQELAIKFQKKLCEIFPEISYNKGSPSA
jgi:hypothetical protein